MEILIGIGVVLVGLALIAGTVLGWFVLSKVLGANAKQLETLARLLDQVSRRLIVASAAATDQSVGRMVARHAAAGDQAAQVADAIRELRESGKDVPGPAPSDGPGSPDDFAQAPSVVSMLGDEGFPGADVPIPGVGPPPAQPPEKFPQEG